MMKIVAGLIAFILGLSSFLLLFSGATRTETVIDISFVLQPGERYGLYENGIYYHTKVFTRSTLIGEVVVESGEINFTAIGYNTWHLENVFISQNYSFVIDPADDLYAFVFDNTWNSIQSSVRFTLKEKWINIFFLVPAFSILMMMVPTGAILTIWGLKTKTSNHKH